MYNVSVMDTMVKNNVYMYNNTGDLRDILSSGFFSSGSGKVIPFSGMATKNKEHLHKNVHLNGHH